MTMIEVVIERGLKESLGPVESFDFRTPVEIAGLTYIFKGSMPLIRKRFDWFLVTPEMEDYKIKRELSPFFDTKAAEIGYVWHGCAAGYIRVEHFRNAEGLYLVDLWSHTPLLTKSSPHHNATGVGNFLLTNLLAVADRKNEPVYLSPAPPPGGRLNREQVIQWYERNGFQHLPPEQWRPSAKMVRYPNPPKVVT